MRRLQCYLIGLLIVVVLIAGVACAPSATPSATPSPSQAPAQSSPPTAASTKPAADPDWKVDWDNTVAAAKKEGKVVVAGFTGDIYRKALTSFQTAYPDIQVEYTGAAGSVFSPKVLSEREGGQYLWDVHAGGVTSMLTSLKPKGVLDPLRSVLVLPEVLDDSKWVGGFDDPWQDSERKYAFGFEGSLFFPVWVNRDILPESELNSIDQLVDPKFKGKIGGGDPRLPGGANGAGAHLLTVKGEEWLRKLYAQDVIVLSDERQLAEGLVRGRYPIIVGINPASLEQLKQEGVGQNVVPLAPDSEAGVSLSSNIGNLALINRAPHPNAAKVYVNWLLSKEGQQSYADTMRLASRRLDVPGPAGTSPKAGVKYRDLNKEDMVPFKNQVMALAKEVIK